MAAYLGISVRSFNRSLKQVIDKGGFDTPEFNNVLQLSNMKKLLERLK
jgi:hypothetical protein